MLPKGLSYLAKSNMKLFSELLLPSSVFHRLYPPPLDHITRRAQHRKDFQEAVQALLVLSRNNSSIQSTPADASDLASYTLEDLKDPSRHFSTDQLMKIAKIRFSGRDSDNESKEVERDPSIAVEAWRQASRQGNTDASYSVAFCLMNGIGVERNNDEAFILMSSLADYDNGYAHFALGNMYSSGLGTSVDHKQAFHHYKKAADEGIPPAVYNLGNMYAAGKGVEKNDESAIACYEAAGRHGDKEAKYMLGNWLCEGKRCQKDFNKGISLLIEAASKNHARANYSIGVFYLEGSEVPRDPLKAIVWFEKASELGMCEASFNLGMLHMQGDGVDKNLQKAREYFIKGTKQNPKNDSCYMLLKEVDKLVAEEEGKPAPTNDAKA